MNPDESQPVKLVLRALPGISQFVNQQLEKYPLREQGGMKM